MAPPLQALSILLLAGSMLVMAASAEPPPSGYQFELVHIDAKGGFTKNELIRRATHRSNLRAEALSSTSATTMRYSRDDYEYHMDLSINGALVSVIADTGSDLIWVPIIHCGFLLPLDVDCHECQRFMNNMKCRSTRCFYEREYAEGSKAVGYLARGMVTAGRNDGHTKDGREIKVGCTDKFSSSPEADCHLHQSSGVAGLGRGELSLVTQLGSGKFSYCLTDYLNPELNSPINFGDLASLPEKASTTKLVMKAEDPSRSKYFVKIKGISMQGTGLSYSFRDGDGYTDMFIDSGAPLTRLPKKAFSAVGSFLTEKFVRKQSRENKDFHCYEFTGTELPKDMPEMVLHLEHAEMHLPVESYMFLDKGNKEVCLAIKESYNGLYRDTPILGNFQQQNLFMLFDIASNQLSFARVDCGKTFK